MVIPFSFTFKSPSLHKYASSSSLSKSSKFWILHFLMKWCKLHLVVKLLSKPYVTFFRRFFLFQVRTTNVNINYDFILSKSLNSSNLDVNLANIWYPDYQNKKQSLSMLNSCKGFLLCIKWTMIWYLENELRTKLNLCMLLQANKKILWKNQIRIQNKAAVLRQQW